MVHKINGVVQAAAAFVYFKDKPGNAHVMLGQHKRGDGYGFPAGNIEHELEQPIDAALRELEEKTNLDLRNKKHPITGKPLRNIEQSVINDGDIDIHVAYVDFGTLSEGDIRRLHAKIRPQLDLGGVQLVSQNDLKNYNIFYRNLEIINKQIQSLQVAK